MPTLSLTLRIWRQAGPNDPGAFETHALEGVSTDLSLLEALDLLNERLITRRGTAGGLRARLP